MYNELYSLLLENFMKQTPERRMSGASRAYKNVMREFQKNKTAGREDSDYAYFKHSDNANRNLKKSFKLARVVPQTLKRMEYRNTHDRPHREKKLFGKKYYEKYMKGEVSEGFSGATRAYRVAKRDFQSKVSARRDASKKFTDDPDSDYEPYQKAAEKSDDALKKTLKLRSVVPQSSKRSLNRVLHHDEESRKRRLFGKKYYNKYLKESLSQKDLLKRVYARRDKRIANAKNPELN